MLEMQRLPADCTTADIVEVNERDGGVIVDGWLEGDLLARFNSEPEPWLDAHAGTDSSSDTSDESLGHGRSDAPDVGLIAGSTTHRSRGP